jgi:hypothetical protein
MRRGEWCILRTSGPKTLPLVNSLNAAGIEAWTPRSIKVRKRDKRDMGDIESPIVPTFVFARARNIARLFQIRAQPTNPHPSFSIFTDHDRGIPLVSELDMAGFRAAEAAANLNHRKVRHRVISPGEMVKPTEGPFAGLTGKVREVSGQFAVVLFDDFEVKIASWLLPDDVISASKSQVDRAAQAA